jgi:hypothetical protein
MSFTPYDLVYGKHVVLPIEFKVKTLRTMYTSGFESLGGSKTSAQPN